MFLLKCIQKKKVLAPESWSQNHDASFESCWEYNVHGSFGNQLNYGLKGLLPKRFSQDNQMEDFFGRYSFLYVHVPDYMEIFLDQEAHQGIDDNPRGDTSLYVMEPEVNFPGSIEERNACKESGFEF